MTRQRVTEFTGSKWNSENNLYRNNIVKKNNFKDFKTLMNAMKKNHGARGLKVKDAASFLPER